MSGFTRYTKHYGDRRERAAQSKKDPATPAQLKALGRLTKGAARKLTTALVGPQDQLTASVWKLAGSGASA
ncbi:hypothetical protein ABZ707_07355 [Streptomyces sp. NPDC006923]|uniref:hypothetical protein n=1 Tax=Streptomyces sp. NPDC006923 TaxID=3155355 RepID=UPI0033FF96E0